MTELHRRFTDTLERTQWLPTADLRRYEARLLAPVLAHAARDVPFYADGRLAAVVRADGGVDLSRWEEVPVLTRQEARTASAALAATNVPEFAGDALQDSTSGSTGSPFVFLRSGATSVASQCCGERHLRWHGVPDGAPVAHMRSQAPRPMPNLTASDPASDTVTPPLTSSLRPILLFNTGDTAADPHAWLAETRARVLVTYPSYARELARDIRAGRAAPATLDLVQCFGEVLDEETRVEIATTFQARVINRYAAEETGMLAGECEHGRMHVQSEINLVEILDDAGRPVPPGTEGNVVVTGFYNYAMPLIRYAVGDRAALAAEPCPCGRGLPVLGHVAGRVRNLFRFAGGKTVWPFVPFAQLRHFIEMRQLQIVQTARDRVDLHYVPEGAGTVDHAGATAFVHRCLGVDVTVGFVARDSIPRLPGGKYLDYISLVPAD
jgi:phenylacetate-CoA ligase